ncbi:MAG: thioredoxin domain-containing protein [Chitinophagaceae bacterium]
MIHESSPYLLQHAHNPVDWYPWGEEALEKAKSENKPILVSIGYSACHWCHVMEKESFEVETTAKLMNELFINIKIDREERPDLDHIYMDAVQLMTGSGGWPLNVFLTPEKAPFFGGTYFPPVKAFSRPSWKEVLEAVADAFYNKREAIDDQALQLIRQLQPSISPDSTSISPGENTVAARSHSLFSQILAQADRVNGGFGRAPKFPGTFLINFLFRFYFQTGNKEALEQGILSLEKMIGGGIYDQLGGGFSRYSTDDHWLVPHFEKMLYDNALLSEVICEAFQITGKPLFSKTIRHTLEYVKRELTSPEGAFFAAQDADSEGVEGKYYTWSWSEINQILGTEASLFNEFFDVTPEGNWDGVNILRTRQEFSLFCSQKNLDPDLTLHALNQSVKKVMEIRNSRIKPLLDEKVLLGWNALMSVAYCKAYAALGEMQFREAAEKNIHFILTRMRKSPDSPEFYHTWNQDGPKITAFLDDYALLIRALLHVQEITAELKYLEEARKLTDFVLSHFRDPSSGFFFFTPESQKDVIIRKIEWYDGALPSGNAIMAWNLRYLSHVFSDLYYAELSRKMTQNMAQQVLRYPSSFGFWAGILTLVDHDLPEIAIVGDQYPTLLMSLLTHFLPDRVLTASTVAEPEYPLLQDRGQPGKTLIYWCKNNQCQAPVEQVEEMDVWNHQEWTLN